MTTAIDVVRAAIPGADENLCDFILWEMTPYPAGKITAQSLYKAASRFKRASENNVRLCDFCENRAEPGQYMCSRCSVAMDTEAA